MGHRISAVVLKGPFDARRAAEFDLRPISLCSDLTLFPLDANYCDYWADGLGIVGSVTPTPLLNTCAVHHMMCEIADQPYFAVIQTEYFGGYGEQTSVVYHGEVEVRPPETAAIGPINSALRRLGVRASLASDEFDTVGLGRYRHFEDLFESYEDWDSR